MEQLVLFLLKLVAYPVLFIGLAVCLAALYNWLRKCSCINVATPCKAHLITGAVAVIALWCMKGGVPEHLTSLGDWLALAAFGACIYAGGRWVYQRRHQLLGWVKDTFEC
jgi:hypothetical protein